MFYLILMNQTNNDTVLNPSIDPDSNVDNPTITCHYYEQINFLNTFSTNTDTKLLHINARSLPKNI